MVDRDGDQRVLVAEDDRRLGPVDEVLVLTGFRPDLAPASPGNAGEWAQPPPGVWPRRGV
ncbi:hypothetical protein ACH4MW_05830 [Streptomyces luteogriseus]|uniref:hypothetical protein n=1 Tax=Streptomyces luteogriseus TaxID=68233 RepID=UPI00379E66BD